jgi:hypothetical protein
MGESVKRRKGWDLSVNPLPLQRGRVRVGVIMTKNVANIARNLRNQATKAESTNSREGRGIH